MIIGGRKVNFFDWYQWGPQFQDQWDLNKAFLVEGLKKIGKPIEKIKIENIVTLPQLTPLIGFLAMGENFLN